MPVTPPTDLANRTIDSCPGGLIQMNRIVAHEVLSSLSGCLIRMEPGKSKLIMFQINRAPLIAMEPGTARGPGKEIG